MIQKSIDGFLVNGFQVVCLLKCIQQDFNIALNFQCCFSDKTHIFTLELRHICWYRMKIIHKWLCIFIKIDEDHFAENFNGDLNQTVTGLVKIRKITWVAHVNQMSFIIIRPAMISTYEKIAAACLLAHNRGTTVAASIVKATLIECTVLCRLY